MFNGEFFANGGSGMQHKERSIRDIDWLEEHGQCMDNIKVGQSLNPDAGRGAFANRFIPEGGLVAPTPLIHVSTWDLLKMFTSIYQNGSTRLVPNTDGPFSYQLLLVRFHLLLRGETNRNCLISHPSCE
jgi:hypothetical protein